MADLMDYIAGVDEVGRGPLAGPVVTAAVILGEPIDGLKDSKALTPIKRAKLAALIQEKAIAYAYGRAEPDEIDSLNIHQATLLAMKRAIEGLKLRPTEIFIDGLYIPKIDIPCRAIVKGDSLIPAISAASIIAKVLRDKEMEEMELIYPGYGFAGHKGYPTPKHQAALRELGPCPIHRRSFSPVSELIELA